MAASSEATSLQARARGILLRKPVIGWAFCDWANSAFATTVMAGFFPLYFKQFWNAGVEATQSTLRLGMANAIASVIVALLAPFIGAVADKGGARIRLLLLFTVLGAAMTTAMFWVAKGDWQMAAFFYVAASLGFWGGNQFYDSLLTDVAEERDYDLVSSYGYSLGYLGGGLLFLVNVLMVTRPAMFGIADASEGVRLSFVTVGVWWVVFTLPVLWVKEKGAAKALPVAAAVRAGFAELMGTIRHIGGDRTLLWFLLAYWFYIDGVNTVIKMAVDFGLSLGLNQSALITALLITQFVGFPAALAFGWIGKKIGPRAGIFISLAVYTGATFYAYRFLQNEAQFYTLAIVIGLVQGGVQSLSRSLFGRLVPAGKAGEFFGFYNLMGKAAAILGPLITGIVAVTTHDSRLAIMSISILFVIGAIFLSRVRVAATTH
jgi:MFS transporter, UMF1 family